MVNSFLISFKLKNTYRVNSILYSIKQLPIIKKILPNSLYQNEGLKALGKLISSVIEIGSVFLWKFLYVGLMVYLASIIIDTDSSNTFLHIFTFLTIAGALVNTYMFNPTKDKEYAMILMKMNAKDYTLSNYYYQMLKLIVGFIPVILIFGLLSKVSLFICLIMPLFVVMMKTIVNTYYLYRYEKSRKIRNENKPEVVLWIMIAIFLICAYLLPSLGIMLNEVIFLILFIVTSIIGFISFKYVNTFKEYGRIYKSLLTPSNIIVIKQNSASQVIKKNALKSIDVSGNLSSDKEGFAYFHDLFVKRHKSLLTTSAKKMALVSGTVVMIIIAVSLLDYDFKSKINTIVLTYLPYFVFLMYLINRGTVVTQTIFANCDHSMLTYRFFRTPSVILRLFKERLKTLIYINMYPALVIATGLPLILFITGGTDNVLNYISLFVSIIAMSVFFSVHYLVMYYLLQPYNLEVEVKSATYTVVQTLTYIVCYSMLEFNLPTLEFGIAVTIFSVVYSLISLVLVYRYAHKTFKLHR